MTTTPIEAGCVVVAVDGSDEGYAAVELAAEEAQRHAAALCIAHVIPAYLPIGPLLMTATDAGMAAYAQETLARAARVAADASPHLAIHSRLLAGGRVSEIVGLSTQARLVVVGRRPPSALDRAWSGGTLDGIVSRARCPVIVVPRIAVRPGATPRVVIGLKSAEHADELLEAGFGAAEELGAELEVLHAWRLPGAYDDIIARRASESSSNRDQKAAIWDLVSPWLQPRRSVRLRIQVVHDYPLRALVEASRDADRLILVKPLHASTLHHLGRTARGALRFAECPVTVVPARRPDDLVMPPVTTEQAGQLVP